MNYDVAIIGGGLAGLSLSIDLSKRGYKVIVIEKGNYPRHKVCGEYISMESHSYLLCICPSLSTIDLPRISNFKLSSTGKKEFTTKLTIGGFGISRFLLEELLFREAKKNDVTFKVNTKVIDVQFDLDKELYVVKTNEGILNANLICNSSGRKSNLEAKGKLASIVGNNYVGVKYHVKLNRDPTFIEIHNFPGGYCGISNIEENKSCLCYIVNSKKLKSVNGSIAEVENQFLHKNSNLKKIFNSAEFLFKEPLTISGINFLIKKPTTENSLFLGDSAGSISPITGNGMSIALKSSSVLAEMIDRHFSNQISKKELRDEYSTFWNKEFSSRIKFSRYFQKLSEFPQLTKPTIGLFNLFPSLAKAVIKQTHGNSF